MLTHPSPLFPAQLELALLSALLQTRNSEVRLEMYERELAPAGTRVQRAFKELLLDTQLELEKVCGMVNAAHPWHPPRTSLFTFP